MERFAFDAQIARMGEKNLLFQVVQAFAGIDLWHRSVSTTFRWATCSRS